MLFFCRNSNVYGHLLRKLEKANDTVAAGENEVLPAISFDLKMRASLKIDLNGNTLNFELDKTSDTLLKQIHYQHKGHFPINTLGDGNCLFNATSIAIVGNESLSLELRARASLELIRNFDHYERLYNSNPDVQLHSDTLQETLLSIIQIGGYVGYWAMAALSSVLNCEFRSVFPPVNGPQDRHHELLTTTICPLDYSTTKKKLNPPIKLLWTHTHHTTCPCTTEGNQQIWTPNHFVPLIKGVAPVTQLPPVVTINDESEVDFPSGKMGCIDLSTTVSYHEFSQHVSDAKKTSTPIHDAVAIKGSNKNATKKLSKLLKDKDSGTTNYLAVKKEKEIPRRTSNSNAETPCTSSSDSLPDLDDAELKWVGFSLCSCTVTISLRILLFGIVILIS